MVNVARATQAIARMSLMKFFPSDPDARTALVGMICEMCESNEQIEWLVKRTIQLHNDWPGPRELRAVLCSKHKPKDGIEAYSDVYVNGIPSEDEAKNARIEGTAFKALAAGQPITGAPSLAVNVAQLAEMKRSTHAYPKRPDPLPVSKDFKPITQADIERAVQKNRDKRARAELGMDEED